MDFSPFGCENSPCAVVVDCPKGFGTIPPVSLHGCSINNDPHCETLQPTPISRRAGKRIAGSIPPERQETNNKENRKLTTMKKLLMLAVVLGMAAGITVKAADAKENWSANCAKCHGQNGKGDTKMGQKAGVKDYTSPEVQAKLTDDAAFKAIKNGVKEGNKEVMKGYGDKLSDEEIKALVAHMRTFKK
jgi:cytochrome c553